MRRVNVNKTAICNQTQTARGNLRGAKTALGGVSTPVGKVGLIQWRAESVHSFPLSEEHLKENSADEQQNTGYIQRK